MPPAHRRQLRPTGAERPGLTKQKQDRRHLARRRIAARERQLKGATDFGDADADPNTCLGQMKAGREPPRSPPVFGEFMRTGVASDEVQFTVKEDAGLVSRLYQEGFVKTVNRVAASGCLDFRRLGWGDEEGAVLVEALRYAAEHCAFPRGSVKVIVGWGNRITKDEAAWKGLEGKFEFSL